MSAASLLKLQKAGFTDAQVEALAEFAETSAATKLDLLETEAKIERRIEAVERRLDGVEGALGRRLDGLEHKIDSLGMRLTIRLGWMIVGSSVAIIGAMTALFRLLDPAAGG